MADVLPFYEDRVLFSTNIRQDVNARLQQAVDAGDNVPEAERLLWEAHELNPAQLEVYIALYKFYFYKNRLPEAEKVVFLALEKAANLGNFSADWNALNEQSADWTRIERPERVYLYSLKALAFIRLRQSDVKAGQEILTKLEQLDPNDQVGSSVIVDLMNAITDA